jgi:hypothetical protein
MPLFTYVVTYKSETHVAQGSHSNFTGFASTWAALPKVALPSLSENTRKELARKAYSGSFSDVPGVAHTWRKLIEIDGEYLTVIAVQTQR